MPLSSVVGAQSIIKPGVCTSTTRPASPYEGQAIYETDTDLAKIWNGSAWVGYALLASPTFTGTVTIPAGASISGFAPLASPAFTGTTTIAGSFNPTATNTYDLGTASFRWRNIYTQDLHLSNGLGDYTVVEGEEDLYLVNNKTNKSFKFALIEVDSSEVPKLSET